MRILLVDDHALVRNGIASLLTAHNIEVVGEAVNGLEALEKARRLKPDIVLMDIKMPLCDGIQATRLIKSEMPAVKILMLTVSEEDEDLFEAIKSGAEGYLSKSLRAEQLISFLSGTMKGEAAISPFMTAKIVGQFACQSASVAALTLPGSELSEREIGILRAVAKGYSNKEIAAQMRISANTVKYHLKNLMERFNLKNRAQLAVHTMSAGIIEREPQKQ